MAKGSKLKKSESEKQYFLGYPKKAEENRAARQRRHLKKHPNDQQAANAGTQYRRKNPKEINGWLTRKVAADLGIGQDVADGKAATRQRAQRLAQNASIGRGVANAREYERKRGKPTTQ